MIFYNPFLFNKNIAEDVEFQEAPSLKRKKTVTWADGDEVEEHYDDDDDENFHLCKFDKLSTRVQQITAAAEEDTKYKFPFLRLKLCALPSLNQSREHSFTS